MITQVKMTRTQRAAIYAVAFFFSIAISISVGLLVSKDAAVGLAMLTGFSWMIFALMNDPYF